MVGPSPHFQLAVYESFLHEVLYLLLVSDPGPVMCKKAPPLPPGLLPFSPILSIFLLPPLPLSIAFFFPLLSSCFPSPPLLLLLSSLYHLDLFQVLWNKLQTPHVLCLCRITFSDIYFLRWPRRAINYYFHLEILQWNHAMEVRRNGNAQWKRAIIIVLY